MENVLEKGGKHQIQEKDRETQKTKWQLKKAREFQSTDGPTTSI